MIGSGCRRSTRHRDASATTAAPTSRKLQPRGPLELVAGERRPDQQRAHAGRDQERAPPVDLHLPTHGRQLQGALQQARSRRARTARRPGSRPASRAASRPGSRRAAVRPTVADAKIAPKMPEYRPSSRGGMIAAITIWTSAVRPPAPRPCRTRLPSSTSMFGAKPATIEPTTKKPSDSWTQQLVVVEVGELAPQRHRGRHREQLERDDPGVRRLARPQVVDDPRQRGRHHGAGQDRHEHPHHQTGDGLHGLPRRELRDRSGPARWSSSRPFWFPDPARTPDRGPGQVVGRRGRRSSPSGLSGVSLCSSIATRQAAPVVLTISRARSGSPIRSASAADNCRSSSMLDSIRW